MKRLFLLIATISGFAFCHAQAPYLGGEGDGYEMIELAVGVTAEPPLEKGISIFPNRLFVGQYIDLSIDDLKNKLEIRIIDALGRMLLRQLYWDVQGHQDKKIPTDNLSPGKYWLDIRRDGNQFVEPFIIVSE